MILPIKSPFELKSIPQLGEVWFLREDHQPSGSFKDRLIADISPELLSQKQIIVPSSGNLAISLLFLLETELEAGRSISDLPMISIYINEKVPKSKFSRLIALAETTSSSIVTSARPKSDAIKAARELGAYLLRNSAGDHYPEAYRSLGREILDQNSHQNIKHSSQMSETGFTAVFVCTSSGTTLQGICEEFLEAADTITDQLDRRQLPQPIAVQTSRVHPIAKHYDDNFDSEKESLANAVADRVGKRKSNLVQLLDKLGGGGVVVNNSELTTALNLTAKHLRPNPKLGEFTPNAAVALAGLLKLRSLAMTRYNLSKPLVIVGGN